MTVFDPAIWLARFEAAGGGWIVQDGKPALLCSAAARDYGTCLAELEANDCRDAVLSHIMERHPPDELAPAE